MPCFITGSALGDAELGAKESRKEAQKVTRLLCSTLKRVEKNGDLEKMPKNVQKWWKKHKESDASSA